MALQKFLRKTATLEDKGTLFKALEVMSIGRHLLPHLGDQR